MWNKQPREINNDEEKVHRLQTLEQKLQKQAEKKQATARQLKLYQRQFDFAQKRINFLKKTFKGVINFTRALIAYPLGRRNFRKLYSRTYKRKDASNRLKPYRSKLYELGFVEKVLKDLREMLRETSDRYLKRAIAWELAIWHAQQRTKDDAWQALHYLQIARTGEKGLKRKRKIAILQAESLDIVGEKERGKQIIQKMLQTDKHPDLYLAAANVEEQIDERFQWINQALAFYDLYPITYDHEKNLNEISYDDLITFPTEQMVTDGPLVSIILPAYNFASGIQIAIESLLQQTWQNIEILVVDDCSTDGTRAIIQKYMEKDERVKLYSTEKNSGPYVARNIALQKSKGEFVTVNDADDWSHAEKISTQVQHLINDPTIIANTSEHARLTDDLTFYRRGTLGEYIFSNMSSLMFRRTPVLEEIGFWDSVRFAADGEFKRRLRKVFGEDQVIDLKTGPLSLPRQSITSLTGSSAFGYQGFFMGARKEYVESFANYHDQAKPLYYPFPQVKRPYPIPNPMKISQQSNSSSRRNLDVMMASDFQVKHKNREDLKKEIKIQRQLKLQTGLMQLSCYNEARINKTDKSIRAMIDGKEVQMVVYGEDISCEILLIKNIASLQYKQKYMPKVSPKMVIIIIDQLPKTPNGQSRYNFRECAKNVRDCFGKRGKWLALTQEIQDDLFRHYKHDLRFIDLSAELWLPEKANAEKLYKQRLKEWMV